MKLTRALAASILAALTATVASGQECPVITDLGSLGGTRTAPWAVSADGRVVIGSSEAFVGPDAFRAFRWDASTGMQSLHTGSFVLNGGFAFAVSADGATITGTIGPGPDYQAFRWTAGGGMQILPGLGPGFASYSAVAMSDDGSAITGLAAGTVAGQTSSYLWTTASGTRDLGTLPVGGSPWAEDVSADGSTVVGRVVVPLVGTRAFRWTAALGMQDLGSFGGATNEATAVSADGSVVVGVSQTSTGERHAFRWTATAGMQDLTPTAAIADAVGLSSDGTAVVGSSGAYAYRWTLTGGMQSLGSLGGLRSKGEAISADGSTVLGRSLRTGGPLAAYRWTAAEGMHDLGIVGTPNAVAFAASADGLVAVGMAYSPERAFRLEVSPLGISGCRPQAPNSTGCGGFLRATGSASVAANALRLEATSLPTSAVGYFLVARTFGAPTSLGAGQGLACLGGPIGRFIDQGQVQSSGAIGSIDLAVDLSAIPMPSGAVAAAPGESWTFQAWHRDANPTATANLTDSVTVTLD